jgi:hypothetical protein
MAAAALAAGLWAAPAMARDLPPGGMTASEVADWLHQAGYPGTVKPDPTTPGDQIISSTVDGVNFDIYMYDCVQNRCGSLQYAAGWPSAAGMTTDKLNGWNQGKRYIRCYSSGPQLWGEFDIDISPGGTYEALTHSLQRWRSAIGGFKTYWGL